MTSRRNQLLKKLVGTAIGEDEKKLYQLTIERICADMCDYYFKFYSINYRSWCSCLGHTNITYFKI